MFRLCSMAKDPRPCESFLERLYDLPVVRDSVMKLGTVYNDTKQYNCLLKITLETAESGIGLVTYTAKPVLKAFEKPIGVLNSLACTQLEKLEKDYPIITQTSAEVLKQTKSTTQAALQPIADRFKPVTDKVITVKQYGYDKVTNVKQFGYDKVTNAKQYGYDKAMAMKGYADNRVQIIVTYTIKQYDAIRLYTVSNMTLLCDVTSKKVSVVLGEERTSHLIARLDLFLSSVEDRVDKFLPPVNGEKEASISIDDRLGKHCAMEHVFNILSIIGHRGCHYVRKELQRTYHTTVESLSKISPSNLGAWICLVACGIKNRAVYLYHEIMGSTDAVDHQDNEKILSKYEHQMITAVRRTRCLMKMIRDSVDAFISKIYMPSATPELLRKVFVSPRTYVAQPILDMLAPYTNQLPDLLPYIRAYLSSMASSITSSVTSVLPTRILSSETPKVVEPQPAVASEQKEEAEREEEKGEENDSFHSTGKVSGPNSGQNSGNNSDHHDD